MIKNESGCATNCHFYKLGSRRPQCSALVDFYNAADIEDQCGDCPFFKTEDEFQKGWKRRVIDIATECTD